MNIIAKHLFTTKALDICESTKPYWYTSGDFGPYYINTHYLYGSKEKAEELLKFIDEEKGNRLDFPHYMVKELMDNYNSCQIYKDVIDYIITLIKEKVGVENFDLISGGERRDWFFSYAIAQLINKDHLTIYKDKSLYLTKNNKTSEITDLENKKILHIADLITSASSYVRAWIPAIRDRNGIITKTVSIVDRNQKGMEILKNFDILGYSGVLFDEKLFKNSMQSGKINLEQLEMILNFIESPKNFMLNYVKTNKSFITNSLNNGGKDKERAELFITKYKIKI